MTRIELSLRIFAEAGSEQEARALARECLPLLSAITPVRPGKIEPYWKLPELFEISFHLDPTADPDAAFADIVALVPVGWTWSGELPGSGEPVFQYDAVWNQTPGAELFSPRVKWACLARYTVAERARFATRERVRLIGQTDPELAEFRERTGTIISPADNDENPVFAVGFELENGEYQVILLPEDQLESTREFEPEETGPVPVLAVDSEGNVRATGLTEGDIVLDF